MLEPMRMEFTPPEEEPFDIYSRLLEARIIYLSRSVDDEIANSIIAQMLFLAHEGPNQDIQLYINSSGGDVYPGLALYDTMVTIQPEVMTITNGVAGGIAAVLAAGGSPGKRYTYPSSTFVIQEGAFEFPASLDMTEEALDRARALVEKQHELLAQLTGKSLDKIKLDATVQRRLNAREAVEYGIIDQIGDPKI